MAIFNSYVSLPEGRYLYISGVDFPTGDVPMMDDQQSIFPMIFHMDQDRGAQNLHFTIESVGNPEGPLAYFLLYLFVIRLSVIRCQVNSIILLVGESQLLLLKSTVGEWNLQSFKWAVVGQVKSFPSSKTPGSVRGDGMPSTTSARRLFYHGRRRSLQMFWCLFPMLPFQPHDIPVKITTFGVQFY